jgi:dihydroflavonol-4-reductase
MTNVVIPLHRSPAWTRSHPERAHRWRRALVTGGSGYVGQYLVSALVERGYFVRVLDPVPPPRNAPASDYLRGSILDGAAVARALLGIDCVFHLAAIPHLWAADAAEFDRVNRGGTEAMLSAALEANVARFVHCSTEAILFAPRSGGATVDETVTLDPADMPGPYTRSKCAAELAALAAARAGLNVVVVNPAIPIGPGDRNMTPPTAMLLRFLGGTPFYLDCTLNLVDMRDVAAGMILAAQAGRIGERYILSGESVSLQQVLDLLAQARGRKTKAWRVPAPVALTTAALCEWVATHVTRRRPAASIEGVKIALRSVPIDSGKAQRELGYAPRPIADALRETVAVLRGVARAPSLQPEAVA